MPVRDDSVREQIMQVGGRALRVAIRPGTGTLDGSCRAQRTLLAKPPF